MLAEIQFGLASVKSAFDLLKGINTLTVEADKAAAILDIRERVGDAQNALVAAQEAYTAAIEREKTLKEEIVKLKDWSAEKQQYELADTGNGTLAFRPKEGVQEGKPTHWLCPQCFEDGKPRFLQPQKHPGLSETLDCNACGLVLITRGRRDHIIPPARPRR